MREILKNPIPNFIFFSYVLNATWEWSQTPFFINAAEELDTIIWYRIHCTLGDTLILMAGFAVISIYRRGLRWAYNPKAKDYLVLVLFGGLYTFFSEYLNVYVRHSWEYSRYMPLLPVIPVGIIPLLQWIILPPVIMFITMRQIRP
jgi:hypothetical protein